MTSLCTSIDYPFLKDRTLGLWTPTVSSTSATIATQPLERGEGEGSQSYHLFASGFSTMIRAPSPCAASVRSYIPSPNGGGTVNVPAAVALTR